MRLLRPVALAAVVAFVAAGGSTAGTSAARPSGSQRTCGLPDYGTGPELVFGRAKTQALADKLRAQVQRQGFVNAAIEADCTDFRVVVRGYDTWDVATAVQAEANQKSTFRPTVECYQAPDKGGEIEVAIGHARDLPSAKALIATAASRGFVNAKLEADACGGYEVEEKGFTTKDQAQTFAEEAFRVGFAAHVEFES